MSRPPSERTLEARDREILKDVIRTFILTSEPVSSRSVAKQGRLGLSAASIRNVMADLEDLGYLAQPHTSAGRVPTAAGYHLYVDSLMSTRLVPARERRYIKENLGESPAAEDLMSSATHLLTELSHQIGFVLTPSVGDTVLKTVHFLPLTGNRVLCVVVSASGFVDNRVIETRRPLGREELLEISNYLTDSFAGLTLRQIRDELLRLMAEERAQMDLLLANAISLAQQALGTEEAPELLLEGTELLLSQPELSDVERVRKLLGTFADKARVVRFLTQLIDGPGVRVIIGEESDLTSDLDFSLVATTYGRGDRPLGSLGIFGPSRMDYQKVVPLVSYLGEKLGQALDQAPDRE